MTVRTPNRLLVGAALVAMTLVTLSSTPALAVANQGGPEADCEASGGVWDQPSHTCGKKTCNVMVGTFWVRGGTSFVGPNGNLYVCDGVTGTWK